MEINLVLDQLSLKEKMLFIKKTSSEYFRYTLRSELSKKILTKLEKQEELTLKEWQYIMERLFLVLTKRKSEEDEIDFTDKMYAMISKIGMKIFKENSPMYNEFYQMLEFVTSMQENEEIDDDLTYGFKQVLDSYNQDDLIILLRQFEEACCFQENRDKFLRCFKEKDKGIISDDEKMNIKAFHNAAERSKQLKKSIMNNRKFIVSNK